MNLPSAIREDHDPFAFLGLVSGYARLLIFLRWASYKCPHCGFVFRRDYWTSNVHLGPGHRDCTECGQSFDDGAREWPELTLAQKSRIFLPPLLVAIWGGFVVAAVISMFIGPHDEHTWPVFVLVSMFGLLPALVWSPIPAFQVIRSIRRYTNRGIARTA